MAQNKTLINGARALYTIIFSSSESENPTS